jgi:hypothetical protein
MIDNKTFRYILSHPDKDEAISLAQMIENKKDREILLKALKKVGDYPNKMYDEYLETK